MTGTADTMDRYVVVLEYQPLTPDEAIGYNTVHSLVAELREWHPTALFSPERYALQLHVMAHRPTEALKRGLQLHDQAVDALGVAAPSLARIEVLTAGEFEGQWDVLGTAASPATMGDSVLSNELYWATRALLRAASASELTDILVNFVTAVGGQIERGAPESAPELVAIDVSLDVDATLVAVAERVSVSRLILEHSLPTLVADARAALSRRQGRLPSCNERRLPGPNE